MFLLYNSGRVIANNNLIIELVCKCKGGVANGGSLRRNRAVERTTGAG